MVCIDDLTLDTGRHNPILLCSDKNSGRCRSPGIGEAIQFARYLCGYPAGQPFEMPPARLRQNHLTQGRWILHYHTLNLEVHRQVKCTHTAKTAARRNDGRIARHLSNLLQRLFSHCRQFHQTCRAEDVLAKMARLFDSLQSQTKSNADVALIDFLKAVCKASGLTQATLNDGYFLKTFNPKD